MSTMRKDDDDIGFPTGSELSSWESEEEPSPDPGESHGIESDDEDDEAFPTGPES